MPKGLEWFPFYAKDWMTDFKVLTMSNQERGQYITLLCIQWIEGSLPVERDDLDALLHDSVSDKVLLCFPPGEWDSTRRCNPRLHVVREQQLAKYEKASARNKQAAQSRWSENNATGMQPASKSHPTRMPETSSSSSSSLSKKVKGKAKDKGYTQRFDGEFWEWYPRKIGKGAAFTIFSKLSDEDKDAILADLVTKDRPNKDPDWKKDGGRYVPHPSTYLNQRRWEDEWTTPNSSS